MVVVPACPASAVAVEDPAEPEWAPAAAGPLGTTVMERAAPVFPELASDCAKPPWPPLPVEPPDTAALESPVEPDEAEERASPPLAVALSAVASPELPAVLWAYEPLGELEGATPLSVALAAPVLPDPEDAKLEPSGASPTAVLFPEPPDWAEAGGCWLCPGLLVSWAGPAPWPELLAAPLLVAEAAPASPERATAPASPWPATATVVLLPELPELALELDDEPLPGTVLNAAGLLDEPPFEDAPPALPDRALAADPPVGAAAAAIAQPEPPDCACELDCGCRGATAVLVPSWGLPLQEARWASPD